MNNALALLITVLLLAGNGYFVACEFALTASRASRLEPLAETSKRATKVLKATRNLNEMLAACQLGVTLCSVALGALAEPVIAGLLLIPFTALGLGYAVAHTVAFVVALLLVTALHVIFGEMVPKNLSVTHPERVGVLFVPSLLLFAKIFHPLTFCLNWLSIHIVRLFGMKPKDEVVSAFTAQEVASIVEASEAAGVLTDTQGLISGALEFSEHQVSDTMVKMSDVVTYDATATPEDIERGVAEHGFSRFVIVNGENILGYVHVKDILGVEESARRSAIPYWRIRRIENVHGEEEVEDALRLMQRTGTHMARVVDGAGGTQGIIFLEDVIEDLVGDVRDTMQRRKL